MSSAVAADQPAAMPATGAPGAGSVYRVELRKVVAQLPPRIVALACLIGPFVVAAVLKGQSALPEDTLFGRWVQSSGFAVPLFLLGFAGSWGFPVLIGVLAGDVFSSEDRYDTWKTLLGRSCRRRDIFAGKVLAACTCTAAALALLAISSLVAGLVVIGSQPLVGLSGALLSPGRCVALVLAAWLVTLLPVLAFTSIALLVSLVTRNGIAGVLSAPVIALVMQLLTGIGTGVVVRTALVGSAFDAWHGLLASKPFFTPLVLGAVVSVVWTASCLAVAWRVLRTRDLGGTGARQRRGWVRPLRAIVVAAALIALLAVATNWGPSGVTAARLEGAITTTFSNLTVLQQRALGHYVPPGASLNVLTTCKRRGGVSSRGPGDDWTCTFQLFTPAQGGPVPLNAATSVTYDLGVKANGCYKAESPPAYIGQRLMRDAHGHNVINPLYAFDGCLDAK